MTEPSRPALPQGIVEHRFVLAGALIVFLGLALLGGVAWWLAGVGFAAVIGLVVLQSYFPGAASGDGTGETPQPATDPAMMPRDEDAKRLMAAFAGALPDPFILLDTGGIVLLANQSGRRMFPQIRANAHISAGLRSPVVLEAIDGLAQNGPGVTVDFEQRVPVERRLEAHISHIADMSPYGVGENRPAIAISVRDLTDRERVERMRADFVANASHELRTPLASVLGFIETLQGAARDDKASREKFLELMRSQASRMSRLIDDLLSLNRIEMNAHLRPEAPVDIHQVLSHVVEIMQPLAADSDVALNLTDHKPGPVVPADHDELVQVFQNLIENAIRYGASGKKVDISIDRDATRGGQADGDGEGSVEIRIRDFGPGIAADEIPRLTERFYRVDVQESRQKGGTGLGLAIVKHIIARHHGRLTITSKPGEGAEFAVSLPSG